MCIYIDTEGEVKPCHVERGKGTFCPRFRANEKGHDMEKKMEGTVTSEEPLMKSRLVNA